MATLDRLAPPPAAARTGAAWSPRRAIAVAFFLAAAIAALQVFQSSGFANAGAEIQRLQTEQQDLTAQVHVLEADVAALSSLDRVERQARDRLGMVPARNIVYLDVPVAAPDQPLLPRPIVTTRPPVVESIPWWQRLLKALPVHVP